MGRFLNADAFASTGQGILGNNMFAYCLNNPIMNTDALGTSAQYAQIVDTVDEICANLLHALRNAEDITQKLNHAMINNAEELYTYNRIYGRLAATYYFVKMVKPGGEWDFKSQKEWGLKSGKFYLYNGKLLAYDDIGNIHYGFVGSVLFAEDVLLEAGGYVQLYTKTSSLSYWNSNWDDPRDQKAIKFGCQLWREGFE